MIQRTLSAKLRSLAGPYPVVYLTGPRQSGKTTLARATFPEFLYISMEDLQNRRDAVDDPRGFLRRLEGVKGVILDEAQRAPDLFSYLQGFVDDARGGPFILTGSQQFLLSEKISQSLAGRAAVLELLPFSIAELDGRPGRTLDDLRAVPNPQARPPSFGLEEILHRGLFPPIHDRQLDPSVWLDGYVRTYVERDVRQVAGVGDLDAFSRFLGLCAGRAGGLLNLTSLGADAGVSHVTARRWLSILRASYVVDLLQPHFENYSKRLVKRPKLYFLDTGLLCHLLGIRRASDLRVHPLRGQIFENLVFLEFRKVFLNQATRSSLYFWRDQRGTEVDLLVDLGNERIPVEAKSGETIAPDFFDGLDAYTSLSKGNGGVLVHGGNESYPRKAHQVRAWWACS